MFIAGDKAPFLQKIKTAREAQWKIRMVCIGILRIHIEREAEPDMLELCQSWPPLPTLSDGINLGLKVRIYLNEEYFTLGSL